MPSGTLFVVATPIGNLEDITLRALRVLREADVIAAEDTRRTAKLLARHGISTPTVSFHAHNTRSRTPQLLARMQSGACVAVVSDAGTPGVSDPGAELVQACREHGIRVDPIPGPSAALAAAMVSGFALTPMTFLGFAPARSHDRYRWLTAVSEVSHTCVFFEAPTRIARLLTDAADIMGSRPIVIARELTKVHQELIAGTSGELRGRFPAARGEFTVVVGPSSRSSVDPASATDDDIAAEFWRLANIGGRTRREAIALVAKRYEKSSREVYLVVERLKNQRK